MKKRMDILSRAKKFRLGALFSARRVCYLILLGMVMLFLYSMIILSRTSFDLGGIAFTNCIISVIVMFFTITLFFCCIQEKSETTKRSRLFLMITAATFLLSFLSLILYRLSGKAEYVRTIFLLTDIYYFILDCIWYFFFLYVKENIPRHKYETLATVCAHICFGIAILLLIVNRFFPVYYSIQDGNVIIVYSDLVATVEILVELIAMIFYILTAKCTAFIKVSMLSFPLLVLLFSAFFVLFPADLPKDPLLDVSSFIILTGLVILFNNVYLERGRELNLKNQQLAESRINAMFLQLNPHFVNNTLGSISGLCHQDPDQAEKMIARFSEYLQDYYSSMAQHTVIPFTEEIARLEHYLSIEQIRFPNISVRFDLKVTRFDVPCLTLQPLVENAIRHGICKRPDSRGLISISTRDTEDEIQIRIEDDGVGYRPDRDDQRPHLGIENVSKRLELLCGGSLRVSGLTEKGTVCIIQIPKEGQP